MKSIDTIKNNFEKRGFSFSYHKEVKEAIEFILQLIPEKSTVGFGGSVTVTESGLLSAMQQKDYQLIHRALISDLPVDVIFKKIYESDWFISSANALTENGEIINIDGRGNRVSAILDGPKNVVIFCGQNKIVENIEKGIERTRNIASPKNCVRLKKKTPCAITGKCMNCNSTETICRATVILHHPTSGTNVYVVVAGADLGY